MYTRAKYKDSAEFDWRKLENPVATLKRDGANFFMRIENDGSPRFFSRRQSVKGDFPERTSQLPHLANVTLPLEFRNRVYNVELVHTGKNKSEKDDHSTLSGILNSLPERSIRTQDQLGPVRAVVHNVIYPELPTYASKLLDAKALEKAFGNKDILWVDDPALGHKEVNRLIDLSQHRGLEGVIVTSASAPESTNVRVKVKHKQTFNLIVVEVEQEKDKYGIDKPSMGALVVADRSGRRVANVGTGFTHAQRKEIWENRAAWKGKLIQVKSMGLAANRLRFPVYNGEADGELDLVK